MPTPSIPHPETRFEAGFAAHLAVALRSAECLGPPMAAVTAACLRALRGGGKLLLFGNGGSAADAQHIASELTIGFGRRRGGIAALALTTDASALTAAGNDLGFEQVFARQVEALGRPGDVALGLTTSGRSPNVLAALRTARRAGLSTIGWTGRGRGGASRPVRPRRGGAERRDAPHPGDPSAPRAHPVRGAGAGTRR